MISVNDICWCTLFCCICGICWRWMILYASPFCWSLILHREGKYRTLVNEELGFACCLDCTVAATGPRVGTNPVDRGSWWLMQTFRDSVYVPKSRSSVFHMDIVLVASLPKRYLGTWNRESAMEAVPKGLEIRFGNDLPRYIYIYICICIYVHMYTYIYMCTWWVYDIWYYT